MDSSTRNIKAILFLLLIPLIGLHSQVLNVTTILDSGVGSLRQAIDMSNEGDTIQFSTLTDGSAILLTSGEIAIDHDLVIIGNDTTNTIISGNGMSRIFTITDADVTIVGITFMNGTTTMNGGAIQVLNSNLEFHSSSVVNSQANQQGGGIYVEGGSLLVQNSSLTENQVDGSTESHGGAAIAHSAGGLTIENSVLTNNEVTTNGSGGAILIGSDGELTINTSTISGNSAVRSGGAIADNSGSATLTALTNVTFEENTTTGEPGVGGALSVNGDGNVMISASTFGLNSTIAEGGAIWNGSGDMTINETTIEGNTAGGVVAGGGGGVFNNQGSLTIGSSSNIVANTADGENSSGGGVFNNTDATLTIDSSTVSLNVAGAAGGGISDFSGSASLTTLNNVILQDNGAIDSLSAGGGVYVSGDGEIMINSGTIAGNEASVEGGGVWSGSGNVTANGTTISDNTVGGAVAGLGGGLFNSSGELTIENGAEISGNVAEGTGSLGGGLYNDAEGTLTLDGSTVSGNSSMLAGGGIADNSGSATIMTLVNATIENNTATDSLSTGGGIHVSGDGEIMINSGTIAGNEASVEGGGVWSGSGNVTVNGTTVSGNTVGAAAAGLGGGLFNSSGDLTIENGAEISGNIAEGENSLGGGIYNDAGGALSVNGSTVSGNTAVMAGGGIADNSGPATVTTLVDAVIESNVTTDSLAGSGAGVYVTGDGNIEINSGTIAGNEASVEGGGIWSGTGNVSINGTTIEGNTAGGIATGLGGGIFNSEGVLSIQSSAEIIGNVAAGENSLGGGIYHDADAMLSIVGSTVSGNTSSQAGAGIADLSGSANMTSIFETDIENNSVTDSLSFGGGIYVSGDGDIEISSGTIAGNEASIEGGGVWSGSGNVTINGTTISGNTVGGAAAGLGGGLFNSSGDLTIENGAEISGNVAAGDNSLGGGIYNDVDGTLTLDGSTVSGNTAVQAGGGIADNSGSATVATLVDATIENNTATDSLSTGGGIFVSGDGDIEISSGTIAGNEASVEGGGIWSGSGSLSVNGTTINGNTAGGAAAGLGGGIFNSSGELTVENEAEISGNIATGENSLGGGIYNDVDGTLTLDGSAVSGNSAVQAGGGIADNSGSASVTSIVDASIENNTVTDSLSTGGGLYVSGDGNVEITGGAVVSNESAGSGGGLWNDSGVMTLTEVSVEGNTSAAASADSGGGAVYNNNGELLIEASTIANNSTSASAGNGGGVFSAEGSSATITRSTISSNASANEGGGIFNAGSTVITSSTIVQNTSANAGGGLRDVEASGSSSTTVSSSIISENNASSGQDVSSENSVISSMGYNLVGVDDASAFDAQSTDLVGTNDDPMESMVGALADNGGPTSTHTIDCSSPAVNAGDPDLNTPDQRGENVFGEQRDIGSFEYQDTCAATPTIEAERRVSDSYIYPNPVNDGKVVVVLPDLNNEMMEIHIIEMGTGKVVRNIQSSNPKANLNVSYLPEGNYIIRIQYKGATATHKMVVVE